MSTTRGARRTDVAVELVHPDRTQRWPQLGWERFEIEWGRLAIGPVSLTVPVGAWLPPAAFVGVAGGDEFGGWGVDVVYRTRTWSGAILQAHMTHRGAIAGARVELVGETWLTHFLRRRVHFTTDNTNETLTDYPDNSMLLALRRDIAAVTWAVGGYPIGCVRSDFDPSGATWVVNVQADHAPALAPGSVTVKGQSADNSLVWADRFLKETGVVTTITESPAATWTYDTDYPEQQNDKSDTIVFSIQRGNLIEWDSLASRDEMENVVRIGGAGKDGSQGEGWIGDVPSVTARGVWEGSATKQDADAATLTSVSTLLGGNAVPKKTWEWALLDVPGCQLGIDYWIGDLIAIEDPVYDRAAVTQLVTGVRVSGDRGRVQAEVTVADPKVRAINYMADVCGLPGGLRNGGLWRGNNS